MSLYVRKCCEGGLFGVGCLHDHCTGPTTVSVDEAFLDDLKEPEVDADTENSETEI